MSGSKLEQLLAPGGLRVLFQPVVRVDATGARVDYLEALVRGPSGSTVERADVLFDYARLRHAEKDIDRACTVAVLGAAEAIPSRPAIGLNVHASTLSGDLEFPAFLCDHLASHELPPERLVVEVVEHAPQLGVLQLREAVDALRRVGVRIALDDMGLGHSNFAMLLELAPDYLKVDRYVAQGCHRDFRRRAVLESLVVLARRLGARVTAEGIEGFADLAAARALGIELFQGFLLCRPVAPAELPDEDELWRRTALPADGGATAGDAPSAGARWRN